MSRQKLARALRCLIWGFSAIAVGAMKPTFFPEGGGAYVAAAFTTLGVLALLGIWIERWIMAREPKD